jgi:Terminase DNA packaging enzyme
MKSQQTANTDTSSNLDSISQALNLAPMPVPVAAPQIQPEQVDDDFEYARGNIIATIEKGREALDGIIDVATLGQNARAYEVAAGLVKTMVEANKDLLELTKKRKEIERIENKANPQTVNNNLFVGSTAELLKALKQNNVKDIDQ